jgi:hypothetical protein
LYENILKKDDDELVEVTNFLRFEYQNESTNYPHTVPEYHPTAALWAANTLYNAAQLILYRDHKEADLNQLFPEFELVLDASAILSADLCLRFLPDMIIQLKVIDSQDGLIEILESIAEKWHYSGMRCDPEIEKLDFKPLASNLCAMQLYVNRIIEYKKLKLSEHDTCSALVRSSLGMYGLQLWKEFKLENEYE